MRSIAKSIFATILFVVVLEFSASWFIVVEKLRLDYLLEYYWFLQGLIQLSIVAIFIFLIYRNSPNKILSYAKPKWYTIGALMGVLFVVLQAPLKWIYNSLFGTEYYIIFEYFDFTVFNNINTLASVLFIPIAEELFFRGYIQKELHLKFRTLSAIVLSSLLFALIHSPYLNLISDIFTEDWHLFYITFFGGLLSALLYYKSNSIGPSIVYHVVWNTIAIIV